MCVFVCMQACGRGGGWCVYVGVSAVHFIKNNQQLETLRPVKLKLKNVRF